MKRHGWATTAVASLTTALVVVGGLWLSFGQNAVTKAEVRDTINLELTEAPAFQRLVTKVDHLTDSLANFRLDVARSYAKISSQQTAQKELLDLIWHYLLEE